MCCPRLFWVATPCFALDPDQADMLAVDESFDPRLPCRGIHDSKDKRMDTKTFHISEWLGVIGAGLIAALTTALAMPWSL